MPTTGHQGSLTECPPLEVLRAYVSGQLASDTVEAVASHIATCMSCSEALSGIEPDDDSLNQALRGCVQAGADPEVVQGIAGTGAWHPTLSDDRAAAPTQGPEPKPDAAPFKATDGPPAARIDHYEIIELIDRGGMGEVYRAFDSLLKRPVAIKRLRSELSANPAARERFVREGQTAARLQHPNTVRVFHCGEHARQPYLVMEYVPGGSLSARLALGPMPAEEAAALVEKVARAVQYAHEQGVLHRDLKPANVLLAADGTPKVGDYGLARLVDEEVRITQTLAVMGTPAYMAPEQAAGHTKRVGIQTDVYGLGAILYETLTGRPPFEGTKEEVLWKVRHEETALPSSWRPDVPDDLEAVCLKCLQKRPGDRYWTAGELADDLARWLEKKKVKARRPGWLRRRLRAARRYPVRSALLGLLVLCAAAALPVADRLDPDREIKRIERDLAGGKTVELIGATGGPQWSRWLVEDDANQPPPVREGLFAVQSFGVALLQLVRDPQLGSYRLRLQVKHLRNERNGEIGCFFSHRHYTTATGLTHQFVALSFNDIHIPPDPSTLRKGMNVPHSDSNPVVLAPRFYTLGPETARWDPTISPRSSRLCKPGGLDQTVWRTLLVDVNPAEVRAVWDGDEEHELRASFAEMARDTAAYLRSVAPADPVYPLTLGAEPAFPPRGGLGLFIIRGSAAFRSVTVGPR